MLWVVGAVVRVWAEAWVVWGGEVQVSCWEEFGLSWWSMVQAILGKVEMDSVEENGGVWAWFWVDSGSGMGGDGLLDVG